MLLRSSKNDGKSATLKDLDNRSCKRNNEAAHNRKLSKEETYKHFGVDFTVYSSSNIKEPRIENYNEIERESKIKNFTEVKR